jgi:hypothetical protein
VRALFTHSDLPRMPLSAHRIRTVQLPRISRYRPFPSMALGRFPSSYFVLALLASVHSSCAFLPTAGAVGRGENIGICMCTNLHSLSVHQFTAELWWTAQNYLRSFSVLACIAPRFAGSVSLQRNPAMASRLSLTITPGARC